MSTPTQRTFSGQAIADALGVEGIRLRRHIRSDGTRVGRGKTYAYTEAEAVAIALSFAQKSEKEPLTEEQVTEIQAAFAAPEEDAAAE